MSELWRIKPDAAQFPEYYARYIDGIAVGSPPAVFGRQLAELIGLFSPLSEMQALLRYAPGKWNLKEILGHLSDAERILSMRALCFARGDGSELPGYDEDAYVAASGAGERPLPALLDEFRHVREATIALFDSLGADALERRGVANGTLISVRAMGWIIAGHAEHHLTVIRDRYLPGD
jgi:hypothetical protein